MKNKVINHKYYQCYDVFDDKTVEQLRDSCDIHFKLNLRGGTPIFQITKCIMDCHGLHLTNSSIYPYCQPYWNTFCKTVCEKVKEYLILVHPELLLPKWEYKHVLSTGYQVFPQACWAIKILPDKTKRPICHLERSQDSLFDKDTFITAIYYLKNTSLGNGTVVEFSESQYYKSDGAENSLFIFRDSVFGEYIPYKDDEEKIVIRFEFCVLGEPHNVPWTSPRVVGP
jgi:hypothetical protein